MTLKDISLKGLFKFLLVINLILPLFFVPIILIIYSIDPSKLHISMGDIKFMSIATITTSDTGISLYTFTAIFFLINGICVSFFQALLVRGLAKYTSLGKITLGRSDKISSEVLT